MAYDHKDAAGFIRLFGLPERVRALTRELLVDGKAANEEPARPKDSNSEASEAKR
jgi:hypothetical protein